MAIANAFIKFNYLLSAYFRILEALTYLSISPCSTVINVGALITLNCFTKPRFHANISKYFNKNPYILNEWCRVSRNKELLFYSNLKSVITVYLLVNLFSKRISGSYIEIQSVLKILVMVLCCAMNTISSTSYSFYRFYSKISLCFCSRYKGYVFKFDWKRIFTIC